LRKTGTGKIKESALEKLKEFYEILKNAFEESGEEWQDAADKIWAFGPRHVGPNILLNRIPDYQRPSIWRDIGR
jgi:ribosome assembly protein 1